MYIPRYLEDEILRVHRTFKVLYLGGPRQVGKTTLLQHLAKKLKMHYVSLDELEMRELAQSDPGIFLSQFPEPLFIDEVQYAPNLFPYIKSRVDRSSKNGRYWMTGSQQFSLMKNVQESLAGRVGIVTLLGFSLAEEQRIKKTQRPFLPQTSLPTQKGVPLYTLFQRILRGCFPILTHKDAPSLERFYGSYVQTYLDRDIKGMYDIEKITPFHRFLRLCAARTGNILNMSDLARDAEVSVHAVREWLIILQASYHIFLLEPYYRNLSKRLIKAPKLYFLDTGLAAHLSKWKTADTLMTGAMAGAFFETFVISEIIKSYLFYGQEPPLFYFRDKEGNEVDLLIEKNGKLFPVEIKLKSHVRLNDIKGMKALQKTGHPLGNGAVIAATEKAYPLAHGITVVPVTAIQ